MTNIRRTTPRNLSIRWRVTLPLLALCAAGVAGGAYTLAQATPAATEAIALVLATLAGGVALAVFAALALMARRLNRVAEVAHDLTSGHRTARTYLQPRDEIGAVGAALDDYADYAQAKQDDLREALRRHRREIAHLQNVLETLPDGVVVQDLDGRVILINDRARQLLGSHRVYRSAGIHELTAVVTDRLGVAIAPGIYALGDPRRVALDQRMLTAQAAALLSPSETRVGTVILLRDITAQVREEQARAELLARLERDIQEPLAKLAQKNRHAGFVTELMMDDFVRQVTRHAVALQQVIAEFRDIIETDETVIQRQQSMIPVETLVWSVANEWRQVAQAHNLQLQIHINRKGMVTLGEERRLRWAIGNIVDNAIKYTPPGGALTLEIIGEADDQAHLRVRDNGVGIAESDMPHLFTRFYRGTPTLPDGRVLRVPGMGQGLYIAREIITAHGGAIRIRSRQGVGTAVYFALPLTAADGFDLSYFTDQSDGETMPLKSSPSRPPSEPNRPLA